MGETKRAARRGTKRASALKAPSRDAVMKAAFAIARIIIWSALSSAL